MKIVITGGSGFIGKHVIEDLKNNNNLYVLSRKESLPQHRNQGVQYLKTNYTPKSLDQLLSNIKPNAIIHLAALRHSSGIYANDYLSNHTISTALFDACLKQGVNKIINISSQSVYSESDPLPWKESRISSPANMYGLSKSFTDQTAEFFNQKGLKVITLRLAQVIGIGERKGYILQTFITKAYHKKPLQVFGQCKGKRHYIYINDVISAIKSSLEHSELSGLFNIGMDTNYSFCTLAKTINKVFGNKAGIERYPEKEADEKVYLMSISKSKKLLGWKPDYDLEKSIADIKQTLDSSKSPL